MTIVSPTKPSFKMYEFKPVRVSYPVVPGILGILLMSRGLGPMAYCLAIAI
jgi:hypothetical protein